MIDGKMPEHLDLKFKAPSEPQAEQTPCAPETPQSKHQQAGPSSLYGRVGDNMTFHTQGAHKEGFFSQLWHWAWKDLGTAFVGILGVFLPTRHK